MTWPRLSDTLPFPRRLDACQSCGADGSLVDLDRWQEHDDQDRPNQVAVVLCRPCSDRVIDPHPRLYARLHHDAPLLGAMPICTGCRHQKELRCTNSTAKANGGEGMTLTFPRPTTAFIDGTRGGRRAGWRETWYHGPVSSCAGREDV